MYPMPDSQMCRGAGELLRATSQAALVNHCLRSYLWGVAVAECERLAFDAELLYVCAALHDLGLLRTFDTGAAFEADSGVAAHWFVSERGWVSQKALTVEEAIVLHMTVEVTPDHGHEAYLLWRATSIDVTGVGLHQLPARYITRVLGEYPRLDFVRHFGDLIRDQAIRKPFSAAAHCLRGGLLERMAACDLDGVGSDAATSKDEPES